MILITKNILINENIILQKGDSILIMEEEEYQIPTKKDNEEIMRFFIEEISNFDFLIKKQYSQNEILLIGPEGIQITVSILFDKIGGEQNKNYLSFLVRTDKLEIYGGHLIKGGVDKLTAIGKGKIGRKYMAAFRFDTSEDCPNLKTAKKFISTWILEFKNAWEKYYTLYKKKREQKF